MYHLKGEGSMYFNIYLRYLEHCKAMKANEALEKIINEYSLSKDEAIEIINGYEV